jgi:hypothetical protein
MGVKGRRSFSLEWRPFIAFRLAKKPRSVKHTLLLRGRHVESTVFGHLVSREADLEGAQLQGASSLIDADTAVLIRLALPGAC